MLFYYINVYIFYGYGKEQSTKDTKLSDVKVSNKCLFLYEIVKSDNTLYKPF